MSGSPETIGESPDEIGAAIAAEWGEGVERMDPSDIAKIAAEGARRARRGARETPAAHWRVKGEADPFGLRYDCERAKTIGGDMTDDEVANAVFLDPFEPNLTTAKDRIRWLSRKLVEATAREATARAEEREACARAVETIDGNGVALTAADIADAIRARSAP